LTEEVMTKPAIGFIGLGLMGRAMVECLQKAGHDLTVLGHRDRTGVEVSLARGGTEATSARSLAASTDIVMLRVGVSAQVESRICGGDRMLMGDMGGCDKVKPVLDVMGGTPFTSASLAAGTRSSSPTAATP
jgi:2-hydroxy-3-oxopropionate reductase